ncbi:MAG: DUF6867 family protein [Alphaproteobacteria bacterium]
MHSPGRGDAGLTRPQADGLIVIAITRSNRPLLAWRIRQVRRMVGQYPWLFEKAGPLNWRER